MQPDQNLKPLEAQVLKKLEEFPQGIKRHELQIYLFAGFSKNADRSIRNAIQGLRNKGYVIVSASDRSGYKLTTDNNEVLHYVNEQIKRAKTCMRTARRVREAYKKRNQISMRLTS